MVFIIEGMLLFTIEWFFTLKSQVNVNYAPILFVILKYYAIFAIQIQMRDSTKYNTEWTDSLGYR